MSASGVARLASAIVGLLIGVAHSSRLSAQPGRGGVSILPPSTTRGDTLRSVTPTVIVQATNFTAARPLRFTLQVDTSSRFAAPIGFDTTIVTADSALAISPTRAFPEGARIFYRATVSDPSGTTGTSAPLGPFIVPDWVTLITPPSVVGRPVRTRTPRFVWHSPAVNEPPGPWEYTIEITNIARRITKAANVGDTVYVPTEDLEPNAAYTWRLTARLPRSPGIPQQTVVPSPSNFFVEDSDVPVLSTSLYPSFPNPFPTLRSDLSCIWFDLKNASSVSLDVYDLRAMHVRRLAPSSEMPGPLAAGRYGRGRTDFNEGCDPRFGWDGTDDRGRVVPEGVYIIRFRGDNHDETRKVLFRGRP